MDVAQRITPKYNDYCEQLKKNKVKWPYLDDFMFRLLTFLSGIFVLHRIYRTPASPAHQTSLRLLKAFPRHTKWAQHQRDALIKNAKGLISESMARQDRDTEELFSRMLNELRHMRNSCNMHGILENNIQPNSNIKI